MKSSKDIEPRVGMQVRFKGWFKTERKRVSRVAGGIEFDNDTTAMPCGSGGVWDAGEYKIEWTPPTDEERRVFMEHADSLREGNHECGEFCQWTRGQRPWLPGSAQRAIADSLALDGADYDDMPEGWI